MTYSGQGYEFLFTAPWGELKEAAFEALRHKNVFRYRAKTIRSGDALEIEIYPIWNTRNEARAAKSKTSRGAQAALNEKNARKNFARLINVNFADADYHVTLTYRDGRLPTESGALRDMRNFIKRVRNYHKKNKLPPLRYAYVIEHYGGDGRRARVHHHLVMSGDMSREALKALWPHGRIGVDELEPVDGSLEGLARYITKQPTKSKRWRTSRNLKKPKITISDTKLSKRQAQRMAADMETNAPLIFKKLFPDYVYDECMVRGSEFVAGAYIYAKMHRDRRRG